MIEMPRPTPLSLSRPRTARVMGTVALALAAAATLAGCSAGAAGGFSGADSGALPMTDAVDMSSESSVTLTDPMTGQLAPVERSVIVTGFMSVVAQDPSAAAHEAESIVTAADGRIDARSESAATEYSGARVSLTVRVPADAFDDVLTELRDLGVVQSVEQNATDVTLEVTDLEGRISAAQTSIDRLTELLATASDATAIVALETALSDRQAELESMTGQKRWLDDQVAMSTLTIEFVPEATETPTEPGNFGDALVAGWHAFVAFLGGLLVFLGFALPWLVLLGLVALLIIVLIRRSRRRTQARAATTVTAPQSEAAPVAQGVSVGSGEAEGPREGA